MNGVTLENYNYALEMVSHGEGGVDALVRGSKWENDPRVIAFLAACDEIQAVLHEAHLDAETREGPCAICREVAEEREKSKK